MAMAAAFPERVESVEQYVTGEELWQPTTNVTGEVVATRSIAISNELPGTIERVGFEAGETVEAGRILVRFDTSEERAQLAAAQAEEQVARLDLERNRKLMAAGAAAAEARDRALARHDGAVANARRLEAVIAKKTLRAPFAARTGLHTLEPGQYLDKGAVITRLVGTGDEAWVDFNLPQQRASVAVGATVMVAVGDDGPTVAAEIIGRDAFVNERSRNVRFRALVDNRSLGAVPGSLATVEVPVGEPRVAALLPVTAVRKDSFGAKVFVLEPAEEGAGAADRADQRTVTLGPQRGEFVVIATGVSAGERVAADGAFKLRHGVLVNARGRHPTASAASDARAAGEGS
jgi:membrane fusion protein (multidrug efflux system)